jgi:ubiquinone/menaquinone biosynthesis C-methylase UbiE
MAERPEGYITAIGYDWLLPLYDPLLRWVMREDTFKRRLIEQARIEPGHRVLDLGCGTATLTILVKRLYPNADVFGIDGDPKVLAIGRRKAAAAGLRISLQEGLAQALPYADGSFDRVLSSLMLHHLTRDQKLGTLREVGRVLRPGGEFHIVDFGPPATAAGALLSRIFHHSVRVADNVRGQLPVLFEEAGLGACEPRGQLFTVAGTLSFFKFAS